MAQRSSASAGEMAKPGRLSYTHQGARVRGPAVVAHSWAPGAIRRGPPAAGATSAPSGCSRWPCHRRCAQRGPCRRLGSTGGMRRGVTHHGQALTSWPAQGCALDGPAQQGIGLHCCQVRVLMQRRAAETRVRRQRRMQKGPHHQTSGNLPVGPALGWALQHGSVT